MYPLLRLRRLTPKERRELRWMVRKSSDKVAVRRAACVLAAATGMKVSRISATQFVHATYIRKILNNFNAEGLVSIGNRYGKGRPRTFTDAVRRRIIDVVTTPPRQFGLPFNVWSIPKLRDHLMQQRIVKTISVERLRQILLETGITPQRTKTWKQSTDEQYLEKKSASRPATGQRKRERSR